ncbi:MAG TPA: phosphopantetheine-binding protein [Polyangiaceae bacterium]|nr:phosphopantetheine-binding protein [Polyangiaceae bacterium]
MIGSRALARLAAGALDGLRGRVALAGATRVGTGVRVFGWPAVASEGEVTFGKNVVLVSAPAPIRIVVAPGGVLSIADGVVLESGVTLRVRGSVRIGAEARLGPGCVVDDDGPDLLPIEVGDRAWVEERAVLLGGARVAPGSVIERGAVLGSTTVAGAAASTGQAQAVKTESLRAIEAQVRAVIARVVPSVATADAEVDLRTFKGWDSLAALRAVVALEKEFKRSLPYDLFTQHPRIASVTPHVASFGVASQEAL